MDVSTTGVDIMADNAFPIVGIGASAGGLDACKELLSNLPPDPGMAFVLIQHLDPNHESRLVPILSGVTTLTVVEITDGVEVRPDHLYIIQPKTNVEIEGGTFRTTPREETRRPHLPVDQFLRSLAKDASKCGVAIILSGTGSDGTLGLCEVKAAGGVTLVQDESSAAHAGMPHNALQSGCVDFVLPPKQMAERLAQINGHPYLSAEIEENVLDETKLKSILTHVRNVTSIDFSQYRDTTIRRRILRRAMLHGRRSISDYIEILQRDVSEVQALYRDLLINVTSFFRDPELYNVLRSSVFPQILQAKSADTPIRIWVAGCSTGEEAYSIAIALLEFLDGRPVQPPIQIFATDLSGDKTLDKARAGVYPETIEADVSPDRLRRFFKKHDHMYRIDKTVRDLCIFARQNITADPPFSRVDLISCRNVLIYMAPSLQQRMLPMFHYALNVPGYLVLGPSETVGPLADSFDAVDRTWKVYSKKPIAQRYAHVLPPSFAPTKLASKQTHTENDLAGSEIYKETDRILLGRFSPPGVLVNENFEILQFRGRTSDFLETPPGEPTTNLLKMARDGLFLELRSALNEAKTNEAPVRRRGVRMRADGHSREIDFEVLPVKPVGVVHRCFLVVFEDSGAGAHSAGLQRSVPLPRNLHRRAKRLAMGFMSIFRESAPDDGHSDREVEALKQELHSTKEYMQSLLEQQDAANEELRSANEEVLSSNEELQSTNEELETAKEELQSANEELTTVNEQLQHRNTEITQAHNDIANLLSSIDIPVIMVGSDLRIRVSTPSAKRIMNLLPSDVGRPIGNIKPNLSIANLEDLIEKTIETVQTMNEEVRDQDGRVYSLRIYPYRMSDGKIDGAVIVLVDIDDIRRTEQNLRDRANQLLEEDRRKSEFLATLSHELRNPLAPMANAIQIMRTPSAGTRHIAHATDVLERQLTHLTRIVEDLLDTTRIAKGKIQLRKQTIDIVETVRMAVETSAPVMEKQNLQLKTELFKEPLYIDADPLRMMQVLINLINNATKFTESGHIGISCKRQTDGGAHVVICVYDSGIGISREFLPRVFDLFTQGDTSADRMRAGLGVGLALVRSLVTLHGGSIEAQSEGAGKGSEFIIRLPLVDHQAAVEPIAERRKTKRTTEKLRILIVEDNPDQAQTLAALLKLWGHQVKIALDGATGLDIAQEFRPQVALIDLGLPIMSGYEIASRIKKNPLLNNTRIIAQTGWGQEQDRKLALDAGFDHHLVKPLDPVELAAVLSTPAIKHNEST